MSEIEQAQAALNTHPDRSPFWDSPMGQEALECARSNGLKAQNTNRERAAIYAALMGATKAGGAA